MWYMLMPIILGLTILGAASLGLPTQADVKRAQIDGQLMQYQVFLFAANTYFGKNAPPASSTAYYWITLKSAAPVGQAGAGIPAHWKAVRQSSGSWVACTELAEYTTASISALYPVQSTPVGTTTVTIVPTAVPAGSITTIVGTGGVSEPGVTPRYVVVGQVDSQAAASANLCASVQ